MFRNSFFFPLRTALLRAVLDGQGASEYYSAGVVSPWQSVCAVFEMEGVQGPLGKWHRSERYPVVTTAQEV